ncbi:hypothetical protein ACFSTC_40255 [Nonomuraea ferruginea]
MVGKAREHITQAVVDGHVTSRSCFYLLLALLSGRTLQQVPDHELSCLAMAQGKIAGHAEDEWTRAVRVINRLLESLRAGDVDASGVEERLRELSDDRRDEILRHLELFLHGPVQNASWARAFAQANRDRCDSARLDRVWKFFQPKPFEPRARPARSPDTPISGWILSATTTALSLTAIGHVSLQAWLYSWSSTVLATLLLAAGAYGCVPAGVEWRYRSERLRAMDRELRTARQRSAEGLPRGFSSRIDRQFIDYFARYVPRTIEREAWLALTDGIRQVLRDEVIELYRESKIDAKRVSWLIRYLVSDVKDRWQRGLLHQDRDLLRVPAATKARFALGALVSGAGLVSLLWSGFTISPFSVVGAALLAAVVGVVAVRGWLRIVLEYKWYAADRIREKRQLNERQAAFDRWTRKLKDKPDDREMASWLDCDRKALTEEAMRHYKLQPDDVIAHAFIEAPRDFVQTSAGPQRALALLPLQAPGLPAHRRRCPPDERRPRLPEGHLPQPETDQLPVRRRCGRSGHRCRRRSPHVRADAGERPPDRGRGDRSSAESRVGTGGGPAHRLSGDARHRRTRQHPARPRRRRRRRQGVDQARTRA